MGMFKMNQTKTKSRIGNTYVLSEIKNNRGNITRVYPKNTNLYNFFF